MSSSVTKYLLCFSTLSIFVAADILSAAELNEGAQPPATERDGERRGWHADGTPPQRMHDRRAFRMGKRMAARHERAMVLIQQLDQDGDGAVDQDEFELPDHERIGNVDADGDGYITLEEMKAHRQRLSDDRMAQHYAMLDRDGDGFVTLDELRQQRFTALDRDGDGYLTLRELGAGKGGLPPGPPR